MVANIVSGPGMQKEFWVEIKCLDKHTCISIPSAQKARNLRLETRYIRSSGMSFMCSPVAPLNVGMTPGSRGS